MKKLMLLAVVLVGTIVMFGCMGGGDAAPVNDLPDFVLNPPTADDAFYGVGYGKKTDLNRSMDAAKASARLDISNQVEVQVQGAITDYFQEAGVDDNVQTVNFYESVSRSITDNKLQGVRLVQQQPMDDGGVWVLMEYRLDQFRDDFVETVEAFTRNEDAAFAEFKAQEALSFLDSKLENEPTMSEPKK